MALTVQGVYIKIKSGHPLKCLSRKKIPSVQYIYNVSLVPSDRLGGQGAVHRRQRHRRVPGRGSQESNLVTTCPRNSDSF